MKILYTSIFLTLSCFAFGQSNNNGKLDKIEEFTSFSTVPFTMEDGVQLMTDIYLPITSDSLTTDITISGTSYNVEIIPKGTQLFIYDSINGQVNPNPYQLPMVLTRTPYGKGSYDKFGVFMNILGFSYALQDMRGRYTSEGVYFPMYSDGWKKDAYHPNDTHVLDVTGVSDPHNSIHHEDGKNTIQFIMDSLFKNYDLDRDGTAETNAKTYNGSLAMFGASALGNTQYQAASAMQNAPSQDGLKGLLPIVATLEYYNSTVQNNGVFRQGLMQGWMTGQMEDVVDTIPSDNDVQNNVHSINDYGMSSGDSIIDLAIDQFSVIEDANGNSAMHPNYLLRTDLDGSFAPINAQGESDPNGNISRYKNLSLPIYHLTGWWDIFIDGQLETYKNIMDNNDAGVQENQKMVIGPWTHATIGRDTVADIVYPNSIYDLRVAGDVTNASVSSLNSIVQGEAVSWLRYLLNYEVGKELGEPKVLIPESDNWQNIGTYDVRIPSEDYYINYSDFLNFLGGYTDLLGMPAEVRIGTTILPQLIDLPTDTSNQTAGEPALGHPATPIVDYSNIPNIRYYIPGPVDDGIAQNTSVGNYWTSSNVFPLATGVVDKTYYLHSDGSFDSIIPSTLEAPLSYSHNPDSPVITVGGNNLGVPTPQRDRVSAGPMNYADTSFIDYTMNRADVLQFESDYIEDSLTIVGVPKAKVFAKSIPNGTTNGLTDTDFFVRIIDVYPDGREYFVVEGAINARAKNYAKTLVDGNENINIPFSNINIGQTYEYEFNLLPIAYSFGHQHKIKVLISSSNWPRYQSNPNLPIEDGAFFRRSPNDGKTYTFNNTIMTPRTAEQTIYFSPSQPTQVTFPTLTNQSFVEIGELENEIKYDVYPNPTKDIVWINTKSNLSYNCKITTLTNQIVKKYDLLHNSNAINLVNLPNGIYFLIITDENGKNSFTKKIIKQ